MIVDGIVFFIVFVGSLQKLSVHSCLCVCDV